MDKLPTETIAHIFSFLNYEDRIRAERVCATWRNLNNSLRCWYIEEQIVVERKTTDDGCVEKVSESFIGFLKRHGLRIKNLRLSYPLGIKEFRVAVVSCQNVEIATIDHADFLRKSADNGLGFIARFWTNLTHLTLYSNYNNETGLNRVLQNCRHLQYLCIENDRRLKSIVSALPLLSLRKLKFSNVCVLQQLSLDCPNLEKLTLKRCFGLSNMSFDELLRSWGKSLLKLKVINCYNFYILDIENGLRCCVNLTNVNGNCFILQNKTLEVLSVVCEKTLRTLKLVDNYSTHSITFLPLLRCTSLFELHVHIETTARYESSNIVKSLIDFLISHPTISIAHIETEVRIRDEEILRLLSCQKLLSLNIGRFLSNTSLTKLKRNICKEGYKVEWCHSEMKITHHNGEDTYMKMLRCTRL